MGFQSRSEGANPRAALVAGIAPARASFSVLVVAGALVGLAGAVHVLGTEKRLTEGVAGSIGFDAITVALLGRSGVPGGRAGSTPPQPLVRTIVPQPAAAAVRTPWTTGSTPAPSYRWVRAPSTSTRAPLPSTSIERSTPA